MRRIIRASGVAAAGFVAALGIASASDRHEQSPQGRAYLGFAFGGERIVPRTFHYGLRFDHDPRFVEGPVAPLMQFDFTRRGLHDARLNGLSVLKAEYRLRQAEENPPEESAGEAPAEEAAPADSQSEAAAEAAPAEEGGFFSGIGNFFSNLFGGEDDEEVAEAAPAEAAEAEEAPAEATEGGFMSYSALDWGLLTLGAVGVGLAVSETTGGDETPDGAGSGGGTGGTGGTGTPCTFIPTTTTCIPTTLTYGPNRWSAPFDARGQDVEYQKWLDGGTGQMGDLGG